jgi:hypothetical protein
MNAQDRVKALEAEAAFESAAQIMGGWDELRRWAQLNQSHCKEILQRFVPADFFKGKDQGKTLEDLLEEANQLSEQRRLQAMTDNELAQLLREKAEHLETGEYPLPQVPEGQFAAVCPAQAVQRPSGLPSPEPPVTPPTNHHEEKVHSIPGQPPCRRPDTRYGISAPARITDYDPMAAFNDN